MIYRAVIKSSHGPSVFRAYLLKQLKSEVSLWLFRIWALFWILPFELAEQNSKRSPNAQQSKWCLWLKLVYMKVWHDLTSVILTLVWINATGCPISIHRGAIVQCNSVFFCLYSLASILTLLVSISFHISIESRNAGAKKLVNVLHARGRP